MSGSPVRPSRSAFGPRTLINRGPVVDRERQLGADIGELMFWQIAGIGFASGRALVVASSAGALVAHGEAWDPDQELDAPDFSRLGTGRYEITYPATAPDETGTEVAISLLGAHITCGSSVAAHGTWELDVNGRTMTFWIWDAAGNAIDSDFLATVF